MTLVTMVRAIARGARGVRRRHCAVAWGGIALVVATRLASADSFPAARGEILITPLVHSSVQIEYRGQVIAVDPWSVSGLASAKPADLILITDDVGHHLDVKAITMLRKPSTRIVIAANGKSRVPDGIVMANGESKTFGDVRVEAVAAYDLTPGEPSHPKGEANGYVLTVGGRRLLFAGVTECVPELKALTRLDIAFMPMNIPPGRMTPAAAAACVKDLKPRAVYPYHYDQDWAARATNPRAAQPGLPGGLTIAQSLAQFTSALAGSGIEVREGGWYPDRSEEVKK